MSNFQDQVLTICKKIPKGKVTTYSQIANLIKNPKAFQAVGQALKRNPAPIKIPCHRVIRSDGSLGGYANGRAVKIKLLEKEGIKSPADKIDLRKYGWQGH